MSKGITVKTLGEQCWGWAQQEVGATESSHQVGGQQSPSTLFSLSWGIPTQRCRSQISQGRNRGTANGLARTERTEGPLFVPNTPEKLSHKLRRAVGIVGAMEILWAEEGWMGDRSKMRFWLPGTDQYSTSGFPMVDSILGSEK